MQQPPTLTIPELRELIQKLYSLKAVLESMLKATVTNGPARWVVVSKCQKKVIGLTLESLVISTAPIELPHGHYTERMANTTAKIFNALQIEEKYEWVVTTLKEYLTFAIPQLEDHIEKLERILPKIDETPQGLN